MKMKTVTITGKRECSIVDRPEPRILGEFVKIKIHSAPMCTEFKQYVNGDRCDCLGHEAAGEVVEVTRQGRVKVGDRVVVMPTYPCGKCALCSAGDYIHCEQPLDPLKICGSETGTATYAQYMIKQDWLLIPIPDGISYDLASMACCGLGPTFGAMQLMSVDAFDTVLITGLGPVGLGCVVNARYRGARVIGMESHPYRSRLAKELGAEAVIDPKDPDAVQKVLDLTGGRGADKSVETSAADPAKPFLQKATRRKGHIALVGWDGTLDAGNILYKGQTVHGSWHWNLRDTARMMQMIGESAGQLQKLITHTFPMSRVKEAWELQATGNCGKVIMHPFE